MTLATPEFGTGAWVLRTRGDLVADEGTALESVGTIIAPADSK